MAGVIAARPVHDRGVDSIGLDEAARVRPDDQREAILLVGAEGLSYEEAATVCDYAVGTIKSRVNRARTRLAELLGYTNGDFAADNVMQAALSSG